MNEVSSIHNNGQALHLSAHQNVGGAICLYIRNLTTMQSPSSPSNRWIATLLLIEVLLSFAPSLVLGPTIGWPMSLRLPAEAQLTAIAAHPTATALGYSLYLTYSVLITPLMIILTAKILGSLQRPLALTIVIFASLSTLARTLGILRWLSVMPLLATNYGTANAASREQIDLVFAALHSYGGSVGEVLGVGLFMAIAMTLLCIGAAKQKTLPLWSIALGLVTALMQFMLALPAFGIPFKLPPAIAAITLMCWMLVTALLYLKPIKLSLLTQEGV